MKYKLFRDLNHVIKREALVDTIYIYGVCFFEGGEAAIMFDRKMCLKERCKAPSHYEAANLSTKLKT